MGILMTTANRLAGGDSGLADMFVKMAPQARAFCNSCSPPDMSQVTDAKPDDVSDQDWTDACKLKQNSAKATPAHIRQLAGQIKHHGGERIHRDTAIAKAHDMVDNAQTQSLEEIARALAEPN